MSPVGRQGRLQALDLLRGSIAMRGNGRVALAALVAAALLAGGCVRYVARPLPPAQSLASFEARRPDDAALRERIAAVFPALAGDWPPARWDRAQLFALAAAANPELAVARAEYDAARAEQAVAGLPADPDLSLQTEYARREQRPWLYGLGLDIPLRTAGQRQLDRAIAGSAVEASRANLLEQAWQVRHRLVAALSAIEARQREQALLAALERLQRQRGDHVARRVAAGEDDAGEQLIAREAQLRAAAARSEAATALAADRAALAQALGLPLAAAAALATDWPDWGRPPPVDAAVLAGRREQALLARADLGAAIAVYSGTERQLQRAVARQYPQVVLSPGYVWDHGIVKLPFALGLHLPVFDRNRGEIAEAEGARALAGTRLLALQARIHGQIDAARDAEAGAAAGLAAAERRAADAREQHERARRALDRGAIDRGEALAAEILATETALDLLHRQADLQAARLALEDALHAPLSGPELALSPAVEDSEESR